MGRRYSVTFNNVSVSVVQDLITLYAGNKPFGLKSFVLGQITTAAPAFSQISVKRLYSAVTAGSGGAAATPVKNLPGDAAATVTARRNDTTAAVSSGTTEVVLEDVINWVNGYSFQWDDDEMPGFDVNQACSIHLDSVSTSGAVVASMTVVFEEHI